MSFEEIFDDLIAAEDDVTPGVMMREPALKCHGKVFAFYYQEKDAMCFKLGKDYPIETEGVNSFSHLSPFKHKPPMTAWYIIGRADQGFWRPLTMRALTIMRGA